MYLNYVLTEDVKLIQITFGKSEAKQGLKTKTEFPNFR